MLFPIVFEIAKSSGLSPELRYGQASFSDSLWGCIIGGVAIVFGGARVPLAVGMLKEITGETIGFLIIR